MVSMLSECLTGQCLPFPVAICLFDLFLAAGRRRCNPIVAVALPCCRAHGTSQLSATTINYYCFYY